MKELSQESSRLICAGREAFRPSVADRARLMAALTGAATLSAGVAAAAGAERSLSAIFGASHAARLLAIALPVAAAGGFCWHVIGQPPVRVQMALPDNRPAVVAAPAPAPAVVKVEDQAVEPSSEPSASAAPGRSASPVGEVPKPGIEIRQEVALLSKAQAALSRGRPQEALAALAEHAARFPQGALAEERAATRARTLCALGRTREAEAELKRMAKLNPASAYLARARESCKSR